MDGILLYSGREARGGIFFCVGGDRLTARQIVRGSARRRTVWTVVEQQITVPGGETRTIVSFGIADHVGTPSPTLVRTRGLIRTFNADTALTIRGAVALLFTQNQLSTGFNLGGDYQLFTNASRSYSLWYPFSSGPVLRSDSTAQANSTQYDPSTTAGFMVDSKGQHRVDGNDQSFAFIATNLTGGGPIDIVIVMRLLWMLP